MTTRRRCFLAAIDPFTVLSFFIRFLSSYFSLWTKGGEVAKRGDGWWRRFIVQLPHNYHIWDY